MIEPILQKRRLASAQPLISSAIAFEILNPLTTLRDRALLAARSDEERLSDELLRNAVTAIDGFIGKFGTQTSHEVDHVLMIIKQLAKIHQILPEMTSILYVHEKRIQLAKREFSRTLGHAVSILLDTLAAYHLLSYVSEKCPECGQQLKLTTTGSLYCPSCQTSHSFLEIFLKQDPNEFGTGADH